MTTTSVVKNLIPGTYNTGIGSNGQFLDRIPDYWEGNGLSNYDYLISPDSKGFILYKDSMQSIVNLNLPALGNLMATNVNLIYTTSVYS
jgi:hypothetical protein